MKKKVKRQLKTDEFANLINKLIEFLRKNQRELMIGAAALAFIALVFVGVKYVQGIQAQKQSRLLGQILALEEELKDDPAKLAELEQLGNGSRFGRLAYVKAAAHNFESGDADRALEALQQVPDSRKDLVFYQAQDLMGQIYFHQKRYDEALAVFEAMERDAPKDYAMDIVLYRKAQVLAARNDIDLAIEAYQKLQEDFPGSYFGYEATREVQKLEQKK
jgi:predicted negative regulator of RcsB-dependent stress response